MMAMVIGCDGDGNAGNGDGWGAGGSKEQGGPS